LMALILGYSRGLISPVLATDVYHHFFEPDYNLADRAEGVLDSVATLTTLRRRATVCLDMDSAIYEFAFCYCDRWTLSMNQRGLFLDLGLKSARFLKDPSWNNSSSSWSENSGSKIRMDQAKVSLWARDVFTFSTSVTLSYDEYDEDSSIQITIPAGSYLGSELADLIALEFTNNSGFSDVNYQGSYDWVTRRFSFAGQNPFKILASGTMHERIGFFSNTGFGIEHTGDCIATPDYNLEITAADQINVKSFSISGNNGLIQRNGSMDGYAQKYYSRGAAISGDFEIARFDSSSLVSRLTGRDPFCMKIEFTGEEIGASAATEKLVIFLPTVILSGDNNIPESGVLPVSASFRAEQVTRHDLESIYQDGYNQNYLQGKPIYGTGSETVYGYGVYRDQLYVGSTSGNLYKLSLDETAFSDITGSLSGNAGAFKVYNDVLYIGTSTGRIYSYDGTTLTFLVQPEGAVAVADFEIYEGYLYVIFANAEIYRTNTPTVVWANIHTGSGTGYRLFSYFGAIYALYNGDVYKSTDGTSFSLEHDFANTPSGMSICTHGNVLWIFSNNKVVYDATGSDITAASDLSLNVKHAFSFWGHLLYIQNAAGQDIYAIDIKTGQDYIIDDTLTATPQNKPVLYRRKLFTTGEQTLRFLSPCPEMLVRMENLISSNPLS